MANYDGLTPGQVLADASVAEFIKELGLGIAEAQAALDRNSIEQIAILSQTTPSFSGKSLIELGLTPPFYHYQYADLEVSMSLTLKVQKDFGVNLGFNIGSSESEAESASSGSTGQVGIEVRFGGGQPAKGVIELVSAIPGTVVTGNTTTSLVASAPSGATDVAIVQGRIRDTAFALANELRSNDVPEIDRVSVEIVSGPTPVNPSTSLATVFTCAPNRVVVNGTQTAPAWALLSLTSVSVTAVEVNGVAFGPFAFTALPTATSDIATAIDGHADFSARVLVNAGRVQVTPLFDLDRDELDPGVLDDLRAVARMLKVNSSWTLRIDGHTDLSGPSAYNQDLSQRRANRVSAFLQAQGVQGSQLTTQALGETQPVVDDPDPHPDNRRAELHITAGPAHVVEIVAAVPIPTWGAMTVTPPTAGGFVEAEGEVAQLNASGSWVQISNGSIDTRLFLDSGAGAPPEYDYAPASMAVDDVAAALAQAITDHVVDVEAWAVGNVVHILPPDSLARLSLYTTVRSNAGNLLPLTTTGSLARVSGFSGGLDPAEPTDGDTVSIGSTQLKVRASGANFANHEFNKGIDAAATATNLATAISSIAGFSAAAAGAVVTVTGTSGTTVATSNANAFLLSASKIPGLAQFESQERNRAMAWGGSLGVRYSRQFGVEMSGNSSIRARLVAVPAPVELLDEIREYLTSVE